jgi:hypothetical protein
MPEAVSGRAGGGASAGAVSSGVQLIGLAGVAGLSLLAQQGLDYAACMRGNRVPRFPDPTAAPDGGPSFGEIGPSTGLDPSSPRFKAAQMVCHRLLPRSPAGAGSGTS